jgi:large subunit ribosomal protein L5e
LVARRVLTKLGLADKYEGVCEPDGTLTLTEAADEDGPRPFKCFLDVGLRRTSTGARVFAAMKGASDGGLFIPHSENRFPGYDAEAKSLDAEVLRKYIYGGHVADYMRQLQEEDEDKYKRQFAKFVAAGVNADGLEALYQTAHKKIREDPVHVKKTAPPAAVTDKVKKWRKERLNLKQRKDKVRQRKAAHDKNKA